MRALASGVLWLSLAVASACGGSGGPARTAGSGGQGAQGVGGAGASGGTPGTGGSVGASGGSTGSGGAAGASAGTGGQSSGSGGHDPDGGSGGTSAGGRGPGVGGAGSGGLATGSGGATGAAGRASGGGAGVGGRPAEGAGGAGAACGRCTTYAAPAQTGTVGPSDLEALSGLAVSRLQPEIFFAHNDHDRPVVYALDLQGREHARITLTGATATDIEDIAVGPCGAGTCVYLGDIGDNSAQRSEYAVLRFPQPMVPDSPGQAAMTASFERFRFTYEDGSHNAEGLMVAPDGTVYVVTKLAPGSGGRVAATGPSSIYRVPSPLATGTVARATKVATLTVPASGDLAASGAAAHPCGAGFLLRAYDRVYEFSTPAGMGFEAAFTAVPKVVAMPNEPQSEAIDYRADGRGFITSGEGAGAPIFQTSCAP